MQQHFFLIECQPNPSISEIYTHYFLFQLLYLTVPFALVFAHFDCSHA